MYLFVSLLPLSVVCCSRDAHRLPWNITRLLLLSEVMEQYWENFMHVVRIVGTGAFLTLFDIVDEMDDGVSRDYAQWGLVTLLVLQFVGPLHLYLSAIGECCCKPLCSCLSLLAFLGFLAVTFGVPIACVINVSGARSGWPSVATYVIFGAAILSCASLVRGLKTKGLRVARIEGLTWFAFIEACLPAAAYSVSGDWKIAARGLGYEFSIAAFIECVMRCIISCKGEGPVVSRGMLASEVLEAQVEMVSEQVTNQTGRGLVV